MRLLRALSGIVWTVACTSAPAQTPPTPTRGQLLYTTHCIACHDQRMHWRDQRHATD